MKNLIKPVLAAGIAFAALASPAAITPAAAQQVRGIGVANLQLIVLNSNAGRLRSPPCSR